jgi:hypothetical protein
MTRPGIRATSAARSDRRMFSETSDRTSDIFTSSASQIEASSSEEASFCPRSTSDK